MGENEEKIKEKKLNETFSFIFSLPLLEIPLGCPQILERVSNKFLKEFDWKKFEERTDGGVTMTRVRRSSVKQNSGGAETEKQGDTS